MPGSGGAAALRYAGYFCEMPLTTGATCCHAVLMTWRLAKDPGRLWHVQATGDRRRQVVLAQEPAGREGEPGVDGQGGGVL